MIQSHSWSWYTRLYVTVAAVTALGCDRPSSTHILDANDTRAIEGVREVASAANVEPGRLVVSLQMPSTDHRYVLGGPSILADLPGNACEFIVGDRSDQALHTFTLDGTYVSSIDGAGQGDTAFTQLVSAATAPNGTVVVSDLHNNSLVVIRPSGPRAVLHPAAIDPESMVGSQIALGADNTIYEHWFGRDVPTVSKGWTESTPLIRAFTLDGRQKTTIGHVVPHDGELFTAALSRGILRVAADTAWFARRSDGRILAYPIGARAVEPARTIDVPIFYRMRAPAEFVSTEGKVRNVRVENHIVAFNVMPSGDFVVAVATKYPRNQQQLFRPTTLIALVSREGKVRKLLDPRGEVIDLLAKQNAIVAIVAHRGGRTVDVFTWPDNPGPVAKSTLCPQHT